VKLVFAEYGAKKIMEYQRIIQGSQCGCCGYLVVGDTTFAGRKFAVSGMLSRVIRFLCCQVNVVFLLAIIGEVLILERLFADPLHSFGGQELLEYETATLSECIPAVLTKPGVL
jgi:hypothetical protein